MTTLEICALIGLGAAVYHYAAYPLAVMSLAAIAGRRRREKRQPAGTPSVALVIAAFNEERVIEAKIRNSLALTYPAEKLSIIVAADGSSDRTAQIVRSFDDPRVECLHDPVRRGKGHALNRAVAAARCDVVVLSDANNFYSPDAIQRLVAHFGDPRVGGVTGAKKVVADVSRAASVGDSLYWRYESKIKQAESMLGGTVTADGEIFAIRRELYDPIPSNVVNDDMHLTLRLVERGYKVSYEPEAVAAESGSLTIREDFNVKVRMIAGGFQNALHEWRVIASSGVFFVKFLSHKLLRWLMPAFLLMLLVSSAALARQPLFAVLFYAQIAFYALAALGWWLNARGRRPHVAYVPFYFVAMNLAAAGGLLRFMRGGQSPLWSKAER